MATEETTRDGIPISQLPTVGELIAFLQQFPSDMPYLNPEYDNCGDMCDIPLQDAYVENGILNF